MTEPRWQKPLLLTPALLWLGVFFAVPLALVAAASFATRGTPLEWTASLDGWRETFRPSLLRIFGRTLLFSAVTTLACLVMGVPLAWFIVRRGPRVRQLCYALVLIPLVANSLVLVYAWMNLLRSGGAVGSTLISLGLMPKGQQLLYTGWASLLGMVYYYLPFMVYPVYTSLEKMDWRLVEASADLGAGARQTLRHVVLPLVWPGLATGCILVFIQAMGTFVIPDLMGGSKELLLGTLINMKFLGQAGNWPLGAAISLLTMALITLGLWQYFRLRSRMEK